MRPKIFDFQFKLNKCSCEMNIDTISCKSERTLITCKSTTVQLKYKYYALGTTLHRKNNLFSTTKTNTEKIPETIVLCEHN